MEFDTKERYKFFCCARQRACAIGSGPRKGHSALRPCTAHASRADLVSKKRSASDPACEDCETARLSLSRRGLHPRWRCEALEDRQYCLIKWPGRIYSGLFAFDAMHVLFINCIDYFLDILLDSMTATMKATLDKRVLALTPFRNPADGRTTRRVRKLSSTGYLSAEMKVVYLFVLPHARGCWRQRPWERHKHLFGDTHEQQELRKDQEKRAWYDVIQSSNVIAHANVQTDCDRPGAFLQSIMWC